MSLGIVVAVYRESLQWITDFHEKLVATGRYTSIKYYIYLKNDGDRVELEIDPRINYELFKLENVGRHSHTYLTHIINNYETLDETLLFLQGNPFHHIDEFMHVNVKDVFQQWLDDVDTNKSTSNNYMNHVVDTHALCWICMHVTNNINIKTDAFRMYDGAQFAVSRECVQQRPKHSYVHLLECDNIHHIEVSWYYIMNSPAKKHVSIHDLDADDTHMLTNAFTTAGYITTTFNESDESLMVDSVDLLVLEANATAVPYIDRKPFVLNIVDLISLEHLQSITHHPNFRGFISSSVEQFYALRRIAPNSHTVFLTRRYSYVIPPLTIALAWIPTQVLSFISNYEEDSPQYTIDEKDSFSNYKRIVEGMLQQQLLLPYELIHHDESVFYKHINNPKCRYLLHIKYWGHTCHTVIKALAAGVPVLMDQNTMMAGKYQAYIRQFENGIVFESVDDIVKYLTDTELEVKMYKKLKAECMKNITDYHLPYPENVVSHLRAFV